MARRKAALGEYRRGGKRQRRLGDIVARIVSKLVAERGAFGLGRGRADQHSITAGAVHLLDNQVFDVLQNIFEAVGLPAAPCRNVFKDRFAACVKFDDFGHVGIDRLVVGNAGSGCIGDGNIACAVNIHDAGNPKQGVRVEGEGIEKRVVNAPVKHVNLAIALRGAHGDAPVHHFEV